MPDNPILIPNILDTIFFYFIKHHEDSSMSIHTFFHFFDEIQSAHQQNIFKNLSSFL